MKRSTNLVIISGPSGSGKDSVIEGLAKQGVPIERVVTTTTRDVRPGETPGREYYFVSENDLQKKIDNQEMAEWARVDNNRLYGVTKEELTRVQNLHDKIGIWRIDWKGVLEAKKNISDILTILIEPPDIEQLLERARGRGDDNEQELQERLAYSKEFLKHRNLYDYSVINKKGELEQTIKEVKNILAREGYLDSENGIR